MKTDPIAEFRSAIEAAGFPVPAQGIQADGKLHRFATNSKESEDWGAGYYVLHLNGGIPAGMYGDWRVSNSPQYWSAKHSSEMTDAERTAQRAVVERMKKLRLDEKRRTQEKAAATAVSEWERSQPASYHPYLEAKGIEAHGARIDNQGRLLVPMFNVEGELRNLERITADGKKRGIVGGERSGLFCRLGALNGHSTVCIAEGFSTGASIRESTGYPVFITFNAGNLLTFANSCRSAWQESAGMAGIICGDDDAYSEPNIGRVKAEAAAKEIGGVAVFPDFGEDRQPGSTDFNDLAQLRGRDSVKAIIDDAVKEDWPPMFRLLGSTEEEAQRAQLAPRCIVDNYLFADVGQIAAAGGTGKTTLMLYESVCISLGMPVWGLTVREPGPTLLLTKEDKHERLLARLREIMAAMALTPAQRDQAYRDIGILDVTGSERRLLFVKDRNIVRTNTAEKLINRYKNIGLAQIIIDPTVSFGASESLVNDNEQGLVEVARHIVGELDCCLRYVHHTGQAAARAGTLDQYASRGGTALPDGCRLVAVLKPHDDSNKNERPPPGCHADPESSITILARPKVSYAPPNQPHIWIKRTGFGYEHFYSAKQSPEEKMEAKADQLLRFIESRLRRDPPERFTSTTLSAQMDLIGMTRAEIRASIGLLMARNNLIEVRISEQKGAGRHPLYLYPESMIGDAKT